MKLENSYLHKHFVNTTGKFCTITKIEKIDNRTLLYWRQEKHYGDDDYCINMYAFDRLVRQDKYILVDSKIGALLYA